MMGHPAKLRQDASLTRVSASALAFLVCLTPITSGAWPHARAKSSEYTSGSLSQEQALSLYTAQQLKPTFDACTDQFPRKTPLDLGKVPAKMRALALCSDHFAVLYSQTSKTPLVVIERLSSDQLQDAKGEERTDMFFPDPRIPKGGRAELSDYRSQNPPVDRGHQAPAADAPDQRAMGQSFALSNMVPQDPTNNRKIWNKVESDVRKFAQRARGSVYVFTGPIFDSGFTTVGTNKVWKPTHLFKLVYDEASGRAWAYLLLNEETRLGRPLDYASFVARTGMDFLAGLPVTGSIERP